jgi:DNA-binding IclR family transcriptional regulator
MLEPQAPGLENGLAILELIANAGQSVGFNAIDSQLAVSRASTARLLKVLQNRGWVVKDEQSGKYRLGPQAAALMRTASLPEIMRDHSTRILQPLMYEAGNTCLLVHWDGRWMRCLNKETHVGSVPLQSIGNQTLDLSHAPWGWIFYETLDRAAQAEARRHFEFRDIFRERYEAWMAYYHKHGYTYDDQWFYKPIRRLATPVFDSEGRIVGALGMGGNPLTMKNGHVKRMGETLKKHARRLSRLLGWCDGREGES